MTDPTPKHTYTSTPSGSDAPPAATSEPKRPMPTGLKVAIGCIVVSFGALALMAVVLGVGGFWLKGKADDFVQGVENRAEAQQEAAAILDRLQDEHPFSPPADGRIDPASAERFLRATALAWIEIEPVVRRMHEVAERNREGNAGLGDVVEGARASGILVDSRLHIARALDEAGQSLGEFTWTGGALRSAWRDANAPDAYRGSRAAGDPVMTANIELARRHGEALAAMDRSAEEPNPSVVLSLAQAWSHGLPSPADFTR